MTLTSNKRPAEGEQLYSETTVKLRRLVETIDDASLDKVCPLFWEIKIDADGNGTFEGETIAIGGQGAGVNYSLSSLFNLHRHQHSFQDMGLDFSTKEYEKQIYIYQQFGALHMRLHVICKFKANYLTGPTEYRFRKFHNTTHLCNYFGPDRSVDYVTQNLRENWPKEAEFRPKNRNAHSGTEVVKLKQIHVLLPGQVKHWRAKPASGTREPWEQINWQLETPPETNLILYGLLAVPKTPVGHI